MLRRNILIFHSAALGDFILTWPLAVALGRLFAQGRVIYVTAGQKGELARAALRVEAADVEAGWQALFAGGEKLPDGPRKMLAGAQQVYTFVSDGMDAWAAAVRAVAPEALIVPLVGRPAGLKGRHVTEALVEQLAGVPVVAEGVRQIIASAGQRALAAAGVASDVIVVHPGAGGAEKCWPAERYLELIRLLRAKGHPVRVVLGEVEVERWPADVIGRFESAAEVVRPRSYVELYDLVKTARLFVGNDSGPGHLAGVCGVKTVVLFGATDPAVWRPLGPGVSVVSARGMDKLGVEEVRAAVEGVLAGR